jgi:glycosyltransferase involved in cell wall biosynthesis
MNRPRVLHLIHHLRMGGAETLLAELLPCLAHDGYDVHVGCLDDRGPLFAVLLKRGIPGHFVGRRRGLDLLAVWRLARLLRHLRIDILNTHCFSAGFWGRLAAILARTPHVVTTIHTVAGWSQPGKQRLGNRLLQPATDRIVAVSESVRSSLLAQGAPPDMIRVIPNGIRAGRFHRAKNLAEERMRLGLPPEGPLIGMIGRCSPEKGGANWIRAIALLMRARVDVQAVLVGDGPGRAAWQALATTEGVADRIRFVGEQVDIVPWLAVLSSLVCPSIQESFGIAALEAQAAGVPVVATRVDGFLEVLHDREDALLADPDNPASMAEAIEAVLGSESLASKLTAAGRRNVARFSIERTAERYAALYRELLENPERP